MRIACVKALLVSLLASLFAGAVHGRPESDDPKYDPTGCELSYPEATCPSNMFCYESGRDGGINRFKEITEEPLAGFGLGG